MKVTQHHAQKLNRHVIYVTYSSGHPVVSLYMRVLPVGWMAEAEKRRDQTNEPTKHSRLRSELETGEGEGEGRRMVRRRQAGMRALSAHMRAHRVIGPRTLKASRARASSFCTEKKLSFLYPRGSVFSGIFPLLSSQPAAKMEARQSKLRVMKGFTLVICTSCRLPERCKFSVRVSLGVWHGPRLPISTKKEAIGSSHVH